MNETTVWWLLTGALVALELMTGTFYLLMLAIGTAAAALASLADIALTGQFVSAAVVGGSAVVLWRLVQQRQPVPAPDQDQAVHLDIGQTVQVQTWDANGSTQVKHRGALWAAVCAPGEHPEPGTHRIEAMTGSQLVLRRI